ncbi:PAS domain S-box protein [Mucilaginibacter sp. Bleaf8]|uniref:PAS domain S-box protein n=1 Tax=Mucilaginibacter sp. Bleaf8 TaxID=2834430 RepID=UPI001BCA967A|nr:PAS domain S-box protein [Mucilaginibacter sp. Bleaf8]MBS7566713.1 PAS domain S-box protein [Mucilaginibacter sp. Bleaf8]
MELPVDENNFIYAKGEMADRTRTYNWSATSIGPISGWPVPLLTTVNLILDSSFPMFIWWGAEKIQFYNDAYREILGTAENSKHPRALGQQGEKCWAEAWPMIGPLIEGVLETGNSVYLENQLIPIYRNNKLDDVYWTFSYNPIRGHAGKPDGILVVCTETTKTNQQLQENEQQLQRVLDHMAEGVGIVDKTGQIIYSNPMAHQILKTDSDRFRERRSNSPEWFNVHLNGKPMTDSEHPTMIAMATGKPVFNFELAIQRPGASRMYLTMNAAPITDKDGNITGAVGMFTDITERKLTEKALREAKDESEQQKRFYETITSSTPDLIYVFDLNYRFTYANKALLNMWGKTWDTAVGKGLRENGYEEWHAAMHEREIDHIVATRESVRGEVSFPHATLGKRIYDYILNPVTDDDGKVVAIAGTTRDITDIKNAEAAIMESEERFRAMAEGSGILIAVADESSNATYFSRAWIDLTGRPMQDMLKFGWVDLLHPDDQKQYLDTYLTAFHQRASFTSEFRVFTKDGNYRWLLANSTPRFLPDGPFTGYITACLDITEQKLNEQRKNDFISMVSHELKTPLTSLNGYVQIIEAKSRKKEDAFTINLAEKATRQIGKMTTLINGFLNVSRLESGQIHIECERFDIAELIKETEEESLTQITTHQVIFAPVEETWVNADRDKIGQVINNLISNAVKYSPAGSAIHIACVTKNGKAIVSVSDQGVGISEENLPRLFERYYRVNNAGYESVAGFGIGLYLCYEILKRHEGNIWAESESGQGSTFYFELPVAD